MYARACVYAHTHIYIHMPPGKDSTYLLLLPTTSIIATTDKTYTTKITSANRCPGNCNGASS